MTTTAAAKNMAAMQAASAAAKAAASRGLAFAMTPAGSTSRQVFTDVRRQMAADVFRYRYFTEGRTGLFTNIGGGMASIARAGIAAGKAFAGGVGAVLSVAGFVGQIVGPFVGAAGSRTIYAVLETLTIFTPASGQAFTLTLIAELD